MSDRISINYKAKEEKKFSKHKISDISKDDIFTLITLISKLPKGSSFILESLTFERVDDINYKIYFNENEEIDNKIEKESIKDFLFDNE